MRKFYCFLVVTLITLPAVGLAQKVLTLQDCINAALKNNWTYRSAIWENKSAGNNVWSAWGSFMPRVDLDFGNQDRHAGPDIVRDPVTGLVFGIGHSYSASATASLTLFDGGANVYGLAGAYAAKNSSDYSLLFNKQKVVFDVKQSYFDLLKAKMLLEVQREVVKRGEQQLKIAQSRYELGSASKSDFLKAKVQFGNDQLALLKAENQEQIAKANLNSVMGESVDQQFEVQEELEQTPMSLTYEECTKLAYKNHPSIRQTESDIDVAENKANVARAGYLPTVQLSGGRSWTGSAIGDVDGITKGAYRWDIGLRVSFNLFEGFATQTEYLNARNQIKIAKETLEKTKSDVAFEVKQAFLAIEENQKSISVTQENVSSAEEDLNLVQEKYRLGAASILELLDAQVSFQTAKSNRIQALFDYNLAVARLERAIGK